MIEACAFLAMFFVQVLAMSVLYPAFFIRYLRLRINSIPAERLAQLYPQVDLSCAQQRLLTRYRALNAAIAVLGLLLLGWLFGYMRRPGWNITSVEALTAAYFMVQMLVPLCFLIWRGVEFNKLHKRPLLQRKRKALLQPRGLFDFISPFIVALAVLIYFLFAALVIYVQQRPFPRFAGPLNIAAVTLLYAVQAVLIYAVLYGKKSNPFETHAGRTRTIGLVVKSCVYSCIACVAFMSLNLILGLLDLQRWEPFALSVFFLITAALSLMGMAAPSRGGGSDSAGAVEIESPARN